MPGISTGLSPKVLFWKEEDWSVNDRAFAAIVKFPTLHTVTDYFAIAQTALSTNNSTTHHRVALQDGGTTGSRTTTIGTISAAWTAYTANTRGTNYTFSANEYLRVAMSEAGTVDMGQIAFGVWAVEGNV